MKFLEPLVVDVLKIPPPPQPPDGSPGSLARFRPAAAYYRYLLLQWGIAQGSALVGVGFAFLFFHFVPEAVSRVLYVFEALGVLAFVFQAVTSLATLALRYRMRWYLVSDRALRIREGIFSTHEQTMSFANIQNIEIEQGPLQRAFGIADLVVTSAGGGGGSGEARAGLRDLHRAHFRGVDNPEEIRALVLARQSDLQDAGLGDDDDGPSIDASLRRAAQQLTEAARALHAA